MVRLNFSFWTATVEFNPCPARVGTADIKPVSEVLNLAWLLA